jgi:hypothetical protein
MDDVGDHPAAVAAVVLLAGGPQRVPEGSADGTVGRSQGDGAGHARPQMWAGRRLAGEHPATKGGDLAPQAGRRLVAVHVSLAADLGNQLDTPA